MGGRERVGELSVEEDGWGRAEQKGKVKRDMNSQRATLQQWDELGRHQALVIGEMRETHMRW
jgi:hypothetical protein